MAENIPEGTDLTIPETKVMVNWSRFRFLVCILHFVVAGNFVINEPQKNKCIKLR
jgi:hypothetical protein